MTYKTCIIIPARLKSKRFPRKLLQVCSNGLTVIQNVLFNTTLSFPNMPIFIATDSEEIGSLFPEKTVLYVKEECRNGTERIAKAVKKYELDHDYFINIQGDNFYVCPNTIKAVLKATPLDVFSLAKNKSTTFINLYTGNSCRGFSHIGVYKYSKEALSKYLDLQEYNQIDFELRDFEINNFRVEIEYGDFETNSINYKEDFIENGL